MIENAVCVIGKTDQVKARKKADKTGVKGFIGGECLPSCYDKLRLAICRAFAIPANDFFSVFDSGRIDPKTEVSEGIARPPVPSEILQIVTTCLALQRICHHQAITFCRRG